LAEAEGADYNASFSLVKMEKKAQVGLDTAKIFIIVLLMIAVIGFTLIVVMSSLRGTQLAVQQDVAYNANETTANFTGAVASHALTSSIYENCAAVVENVYLSGSAIIVDSGNYTVSGCTISIVSAADIGIEDEVASNNTWNVTYSSGYIKQNFGTEISGNISEGTSTFFGSTGTWFALLAVAIIILIIAIVILAVNRFGGAGGGYSEGL